MCGWLAFALLFAVYSVVAVFLMLAGGVSPIFTAIGFAVVLKAIAWVYREEIKDAKKMEEAECSGGRF